MDFDLPPELEGLVCWILDADGRTPRPVGMEEGAAWMNAHGSVAVAFDEGPGWEVSTVFLSGIFEAGVVPDLFETRIRIAGRPDGFERAGDADAALGNHAEATAALDRPDPPKTLH
jgi:hypothetical protein